MHQRYKTLNKIKDQRISHEHVLSIAVRVKNEISAIADFWDSLAQQTIFDQLEIVFLDSGSSDGTLDFLNGKNCSVYQIDGSEFQFGETCNLMMELTTCNHVCFFSGHVSLQKADTLEYTVNFIKQKGNVSGYYRQVPNLKVGCSIYDKVFLKYNFPAYLDINDPVLQKDKPRFSNAASLVARAHWDVVKFENVIASEDAFWAEKGITIFEGIYYFHMYNVLHSHNESIASIKARVSINAKARFPEGVSLQKRLFMFLKVFVALFINTGQLIAAIKYAYAHSSAYNVSKV
jgi:glycosyltransferase involved in cell wall biosynthesis